MSPPCVLRVEVPADALERGDVTWGVCEVLMREQPMLDISIVAAAPCIDF